MRKKINRLNLSRETLHTLVEGSLGEIAGGSTRTVISFCANCPSVTSRIVCCAPPPTV